MTSHGTLPHYEAITPETVIDSRFVQNRIGVMAWHLQWMAEVMEDYPDAQLASLSAHLFNATREIWSLGDQVALLRDREQLGERRPRPTSIHGAHPYRRNENVHARSTDRASRSSHDSAARTNVGSGDEQADKKFMVVVEAVSKEDTMVSATNSGGQLGSERIGVVVELGGSLIIEGIRMTIQELDPNMIVHEIDTVQPVQPVVNLAERGNDDDNVDTNE